MVSTNDLHRKKACSEWEGKPIACGTKLTIQAGNADQKMDCPAYDGKGWTAYTHEYRKRRVLHNFQTDTRACRYEEILTSYCRHLRTEQQRRCDVYACTAFNKLLMSKDYAYHVISLVRLCSVRPSHVCRLRYMQWCNCKTFLI